MWISGKSTGGNGGSGGRGGNVTKGLWQAVDSFSLEMRLLVW